MAAHTDVEMFTVSEEGGTLHHYAVDSDLSIRCKSALEGGDQAALLVVELGIDGNLIHQVRLDMNFCEDGDLYDHGRDPARVLSDAITTLEALRDRLDRMARA